MALVTVIPDCLDSKIDKFDSKDFPIPRIGERYTMSKTKHTDSGSYEIRVSCLVTYVLYDQEEGTVYIEVQKI